MRDFRMEIPENIQAVISAFRDAGHDAVVVGGAVRDAVAGRGRDAHDFDIAVSPEIRVAMRVAENAGFRVVEMGVEHGVVSVISGGEAVEIASFRGDGNYSDGRRPDSVEFGVSLVADLSRRDFRMNAMAFSPERGLIDPFDGCADISDGIIRGVGSADERIREDALRMMRAIRQSAEHSMVLDGELIRAIIRNADRIRLISWERIRDEIVRILESDNPIFIRDIFRLGIASHIMPEILESDVDWDAVRNSSGVIARLVVIFGGHDDVMRRLRFENAVIREVSRIHDVEARGIIPAIGAEIRRRMVVAGVDIFWSAVAIQEARGFDMSAVRRIAEGVVERGDCVSLAEMEVRGDDIVAVGFRGRRIGEVLNHLLDVVCVAPEANDAEVLIRIARNIRAGE